VFQRAITFDGEMIHFTSKERMVVFELADHFGQIRSKDQILNALYYLTPEDEPELKIIDVFICKARKKLDNLDPHLNLGTVIQTVWGRGYRLVDIKSEVKVAS
jgi:two-component system cell cycle response regulator CtrA